MFKKLLNKLRRESKIFTGRVSPIRKEIDCIHNWYGNSYGGFYVHPSILNRNSIVYSFGIGEDISFDRAIIEEHECQVFGFDPTPKSIEWVSGQQLPQKFTFAGYGIDSKTGFVNFNLPKNKDYVSGSVVNHKNVSEDNIVSVPMKSFNDITTELGHQHIDVLKMDIEGSEYLLIDDILSTKIRIDQILIEVHERFFNDGKSKTHNLLKSLKHSGYAIFAVSETMEEISFIRTEALN